MVGNLSLQYAAQSRVDLLVNFSRSTMCPDAVGQTRECKTEARPEHLLVEQDAGGQTGVPHAEDRVRRQQASQR